MKEKYFMQSKLKNLLIIAPTWPAPNYSAAGVRLMQLVNFFKEEEYQITIASTADPSTVKPSDFKDITLANIQLNDSSFDEFVKKLNPDIVMFDRFMTEEQFGWRVADQVPNAIRVLDTEDLHSLRKSREDALKKESNWTTEFWLKHDTTNREVASILRCDLSLIISSFEISLLESVVPHHNDLLLHLPFMVENSTEEEIAQWPTFEERNGFVFIGFGGHAPNIDAIEYLKKDIWPLIHKELPNAKLHIYGGNFPEKIHQLNNLKEGFLIQGWAEDAQEVISKARLLLAPLRFGAGQKGKLLEAMRCGTPSITTLIGAEGMHDNQNWSGKICDDPIDFANAAVESYHDKTDWGQAQQNGIQIVNGLHDKDTLAKKFALKLEVLEENLTEHRTKNFMGSLLQHQTMASSKYMSKWIEEKNKD